MSRCVGPAVRVCLLAVLLGGCATSPVRRWNAVPGTNVEVLDAPRQTVRTARDAAAANPDDGRYANPSSADIPTILNEAKLTFETVEPGRRWMISFAGEKLDRVVLYVIHGAKFTIVMGKLFTLAPGTDAAFYKAIARKNFDFDQLKLSVDKQGSVFASFEVPTRIVDKRELLENIFALASAIDAVVPDLVDLANPVPPSDDEPMPKHPKLPTRKPRPVPSPSPPPERPITEAAWDGPRT